MNLTNFDPIMYSATIQSYMNYTRVFYSLDEAKSWVENWNEDAFFGATLSLNKKYKLTKQQRCALPQIVHYEAR